ncbi:hypothetical protein LUX39_24465 [Actinomadura madurae]|nr:hypothetical protein [Actinomadura madurae]MCP9967843.1 hypothetical protein [Actinomadura madurae]MCQ0016506.1 hypothetical protein [Actinomadura madurae]
MGDLLGLLADHVVAGGQFEHSQVRPVGGEGEQVAADAGAQRRHELADPARQAGHVAGGQDEQGGAPDAATAATASWKWGSYLICPASAASGRMKTPSSVVRNARWGYIAAWASGSGLAIASAWASKTAFISPSSAPRSSWPMPA